MSSNASTSAVRRGQDLNTIIEDSLSRGRIDPPKPYISGIETHDFKDTSAGPKRRSTHPQVFLGPESETASVHDGDPRFIRSATLKAGPAGGESRSRNLHRQIFSKRALSNIKRIVPNEGIVLNKKLKRHSTINTTDSITTNASASFAETEVWDQKALLALDGGGIRGYSALLIIQALMKEIEALETSHSDGQASSSFHPLPPAPNIATDDRSVESEDPVEPSQTESSPWLPCHYFDYMAGTSTGGLISIMLGRLRMSIDDCIRDYEYFGEKVFGHSRWFHIRSPLFWPRDKYDHKILEAAVQEVVDRRVPYVASFPGGRNFAFDENRCRIVVLSYQRQKGSAPEKPYIFRTYKNLHRSEGGQQRLLDRNPGLAHDIPILQVARATSAAPTYFEPSKTGDLEYLDGGLGANNPCEELYDEVRRMNNNSNKCVRVILSIGTGKNNKAARFGDRGIWQYLNIINWAKKWATDSQEAHLRMLKTQEREKFSYFRLNVEEGLDEMKLDEWRVRGLVRTTVGKAIKSIPSSKKSSPNTSNCNNARSDHDSAAEKTRCLLPAPEPLEESAITAWFQPKNMTLDSIRTKTNSYLDQAEVKTWLRDCAEILVQIRRNRAKLDPHRWEKACFGAWYQCRVEGCQRAEKEYERREALMSHLKDKHSSLFKGAAGWDLGKLNATLDQYKIVVR